MSNQSQEGPRRRSALTGKTNGRGCVASATLLNCSRSEVKQMEKNEHLSLFPFLSIDFIEQKL